MGRKRRRDDDNQPIIADDLPVWLRNWINAFPRAGIDVQERLKDWQERRAKTVSDYFGVRGLEGARWDAEFRDVWLVPAPDGRQHRIVDPMLLVPCRSGRSGNCFKSTTRRAFYYHRGQVVAALPICGNCWDEYEAYEFQWRPDLDGGGHREASGIMLGGQWSHDIPSTSGS